MSSYSPKHIGPDESLSAQLREAGRKVLCGTMSLILAASLVPTPTVSYAEDVVRESLGRDAEENDSDVENSDHGSSNESTDGASEDQQSSDDGEQSDSGTPADQPSGGDYQYDGDQDGNDDQYGNDEQYGDAAPEDQQPYGDDEQADYSGDDGSNTDDDREHESSDPDATFSNEDTSTRDAERSTDGSDGRFVARALLGAQGSENEEEEDQNESPKTVTEPSLAPEFTGLVEGTANQYKNCEVILKLRGTNLQVYESALATLGYTYSYTDAEGEKHVDDYTMQRFAYQFVSNAEGTEVSVAFPLESPGVYEGFTASISGIAYDDEELDYELSNEPISVAQPLWVLDNVAPMLVSATLENEDAKIDVMSDTNEGQIVELGDASSIVVRLSDDSLNMDEDVSFVQVVNEKGEALEVGGKLAWGFKKESEDSKAYVATIHNDGKIEGKVAIRVVAQTVGASEDEMLDIALGGNQEADKTVKANGLLVIDGSRPVVESVTTESKAADVPENEGSEPTDFLTNSGYLEVTVSDDSLDTHKEASYIQLEDENGNVVKDEDDQEKVALFNKAEQGDGDSSHYEAALNIESVTDGRYLLRVVAQDTLCEQGDDAAKARHEHVVKTYGPIVLDRVKPQIADVVTMVETETDPVEKQVSDGDMLRANKLIVSVEDNNSLNEEDSTVTLTKRVNGEDVAKQYKYEDCKNADGDFEIDDIETGTYDIVVSIVDSAGNPASLSIENVTFDNEMPQIGDFSYADHKTYKDQKVVRLTEDGAPVEITVDDYSFDADKVQFAVTRKASAKEEGAGTSYDVAEPSWDGSTATLTFAEEGIYTIEVSAEDALGKGVAHKSETFVVSARPAVEVKLADDSPWSGPIATVGDESTEAGQYFNAPVVCDVTIAGSFIDSDKTLIAGVPLSQIDEDEGYKNKDKTFSISKPLVQEDGSYTYTVTYSEGAHSSSSNPDLPVVKAKDWYAVANKEDFVVDGEFQSFTVDTVAPTVMFSESNPKYVEDVDKLGIKAVDSKVLFFNQAVEGSGKSFVFAIADNVAIHTVEMKRSGTDGAGSYDTVYKVENGKVVVDLSDDAEFLDVDELTVTDMAGNSSVWSLKEVKSHTSAVDYTEENEVLGVKQPIKLIEDHTAPILKFKDYKDYYSQNVTISLAIIERNLNYFIDLKEFAHKVISPVVLEKKDDEGKYQVFNDISFPIYDAKLIDDKQFEWELPISITAPDDHSMDGHYRLTAQLTDLAGNPSEEESVEFTIDTTAPSSSIDFKGAEEIPYANGAGLTDVDGTYYAVKDGETFKKIVTIKEHNFDPEKFKVIAEPIDAAASDLVPTIEREDSGDTHTYTVSFPSEGKYRLTVEGNDNAGRPLEPVSEEFYVDYNKPEVLLSDYPSEDAKKNYAQIADKDYEGTPKDGADYFAHLNTITATIVERHLDPERTTVNGERLIDILAGAAGVTESASYAALLESVSLDNTYVSKSTGISYRMGWDAASYTYTILMDYPDGEFGLPIVVAYDRRSAYNQDNEASSKKKSFVVDGKAPKVQAYVTTSPSVLTENALGAQIENNGVNVNAPMYFYSHKYDPSAHEIWFDVEEDFGIRSVEIFDDYNDHYVLDKNGKAASVGIVQTEGGAYIFRIKVPLADTRDFSNEIKVKITDFAGNYYIWSMRPVGEVKESGRDKSSSQNADLIYKVNEIKSITLNHPTLLVEDNVAPKLEFSKKPGEGALSAKGFGRFFNMTQSIELFVTERNLKYLRGYEGPDGAKAFDGLDPDRTVLTVERRENEASEKLLAQERVPVKDLDPDLDGADGEYSPQFAGRYTYSREFRADQEAHSEDGHYRVSAQLTDLVGNASNDGEPIKLEEFTIDTKAPELSVTYASGGEAARPSNASTEHVGGHGMPAQGDEEPYYQVSPEHGLTATVVVREHNFDPSLFNIDVKHLDRQEDGDVDFGVSKVEWTHDGDTHTCVVEFPCEGEYQIHVDGTDKAGNPVEAYDYVFNVDMYAPTVEVAFPKDKRTQGYDGKRGQEAVCESPESTMFFSEEPEVVVHIEDRFLATWAEDDTTINGTPLAEILQGVERGGSYAQETPSGSVTYASATVSWSSTKHAWVYEVRMTYHDGEYDTPLVYVADRSGRVAGTTGNEDPSAYDGVEHFVVDCSAPEITEALITAAPATLTRTTADGVVKDVIQDYGKNQIWFFTGAIGSERHAIKLTASDPHGVRSVELYDPSGRYQLYGDGVEGKLAALAKGESATITVVDTLVDGKDFSDEVVVRVTDFAGNWHEWTMREGTLYDVGHRGSAEERGVPIAGEADLVSQVRALNHPTLLVEDNVAPALEFSTKPGEGALAAKGYGRFFNTTQGIRLDVTERNLKYLRGYEGFKSLDPDRTVLTISHRADRYDAKYQVSSEPARVVSVSDLVPKVEGGVTEGDARFAGAYTFPATDPYQFVADFDGHAQDGHYRVSAQLTDLVGNASDTIELEEFTIDTKAPELSVTYTTNGEAVRPSSTSTEHVDDHGMPEQGDEEPYYQVSPEHGLTAVIRVDEHNFAPELFSEIDAEQLDPMDGDAEFEFVYDETKWAAEGDTYTYEIHFPGEGRYKVHVGGTDKAGNPVEAYDYVFNVDMYAPTVEVAFPKDDRTQGYDGKRGQEAVCESPESTMFFSEEPEVVVHIEDRFLATETGEYTALNDILLAEIPLVEILRGVKQGGSYVQETPSGSVTYTSATVSWSSTKHAWVYEVRMTYHDGEYDTPLVYVADRSGRVAGKTGNEDPSVYDGVEHFVVDCSAPKMTKAIITAAPATLTNAIKNGTPENGNNRIWFFTGADGKDGSEMHAIKLTVYDPHGVRSVELYDPSGRYRLYEDGVEDKLTALAKGESATITVIDTLADGEDFANEKVHGRDFSDEVVVRVTDFAGNWHEWTMREGTLYDVDHRGSAKKKGAPIVGEVDLVSQVRALDHPTLLVEDNVAPALRLPEIPSDGALAAKGYGRFFNTTQSIRLDVTERNLKYLRGYEGFKGLDPSRSVLTISYKADKYNAEYQTMSGHARIVRVKDLIPKVTNGITESDARFTGRYSFPRQFVADFNNHSEDGHYLVSAKLTDLVGNKSNDGEPIKLEEFTIDTKAPEVTVAYNSAPKKQTANGRDYYDAARIATITVVEHNFDPNLFIIDVSHFANHASGAKAPSFSWDNSRTDTHVCTVEFPSDGEYRLVVRGQDKAGNAAVFASSGVANKQTTYDSGLFVIDTENPVIADVYDYGQAPQRPSRPVVQFPQPTGQYGGKNYYSHPIEIYSYVMDRNFDPASTRVYRYHNGTESIQNVTWSLNGGRDQNAYEVYSTKVSYTEDGDYRTPHVKNAVDFAMRTTENDPKDFVVDLVAPSISVEVDRTPTSTGVANDANDPIQFFNVATRMTFSMHDDHRIRKFWLDDPEGEYVVTETSNNVEGNLDATLVIALRDGADVSNDTEYERDITLTVQDLAGNRRIWTIDRTGKVIMDQVESGDANRSINEEGIYPLALIQDTTAPTVALSGVTEGTFYNTTQSVRCDINEFNFDYLKRFDPSRVIVHVTKYEGNAGRAQSSWTVSASEFVGSSPSYSFDQAFEGDGHYEIYAEFLDYANNQSGRASIGEFTIDKTAPVINIAWDNNDVLNGKYYKAGRTATITVTEHNFDASLFTVNSNGSISGWSSSGDTHTCTVTFDTDGTYNLSVSGRDRAGNEATSVTEPEFVVDLTSPKITFSGLVQRYGVDRGKKDADGKQQLENEYRDDLDKDGGDINAEDPDETLQDRHAYNGIVMPAIEFYDQAGNGATNYDSQNVSYTLTGGKHGTNTQDFSYTVQDGNGGQTYQFDDFGLVTEALSEGGHNVYDPAADDVYTIEAKMTDLAGNEAQGQVTFSVNRYGSNFVVEAFSVDDSKHESIIGAQSMDGIDYDLLGSAPRIEVHEINVSGSESEADHAVLKEYANAVTQLASVKESDSRRDGYVVDSVEPESSEAVSKYGWSEYVYTIREGNFGIDSPSDSGDGGQGVYRVNVTSVDRASNDTSTSEYLNTADYEEASSGASKSWANPEKAMRTIADSLRNATVAFTLDEIAPIIDELNVPNLLAVGSSYAVTVHVTDAITRGDTVSVYVDGRELEEGEFSQRGNADGTGIYEFQVATNYIPFATHEVKVVASDTVEGRDPVTIQSERFMVTILVPEIAVIALIVGGITGGVVLYRKRKAVAEPEKPGSYVS